MLCPKLFIFTRYLLKWALAKTGKTPSTIHYHRSELQSIYDIDTDIETSINKWEGGPTPFSHTTWEIVGWEWEQMGFLLKSLIQAKILGWEWEKIGFFTKTIPKYFHVFEIRYVFLIIFVSCGSYFVWLLFNKLYLIRFEVVQRPHSSFYVILVHEVPQIR